ncbi:MAG TPA: hypothetical protein VM715_08940 [Candidatus Acidoferrum sp.]|nr:hypothetical protein [Candidatus Acidoferrum sp.]
MFPKGHHQLGDRGNQQSKQVAAILCLEMLLTPGQKRDAVRLTVRAIGVALTLLGILTIGQPRHAILDSLLLILGLILLLLPDTLF